MKPVQRILVPTDFSDCAGVAAQWAAPLARLLNAAVEVETVRRCFPGLQSVNCDVRDGNTFLEILQAAR